MPFKIPFDAAQKKLADTPWQGSPRDRLFCLLPAIDTPYDCSKLSQAEAEALTEALSDGFNIYLGTPIAKHRHRLQTKFVSSKLLTHFFYSEKSINDLSLEKSINKFPLSLNEELLQIYFQNQFERFHHHFGSEIDSSSDDIKVASNWQYQKPWYESHALSCLKEIQSLKESVISEIVETTEKAKQLSNIPYEVVAEDLASELIFLAGQLGRLVEQYSWRFQHERAVETGESVRRGASVGGRLRAEEPKAEHSKWQSEASRIWADRPGLSSKVAVANIIKTKLHVDRTAKHIARYITRHPVKK